MASKGLNRVKLVCALRNGLRYFKKVNKECTVKLPKRNALAKTISCEGSVNFPYTLYGVSATFTATVIHLTGGCACLVLNMNGGKDNLAISDNDFNYKHKNFFIKKGNASASYTASNSIYCENDVTTLLKAYADNMLKGDLYDDWKR